VDLSDEALIESFRNTKDSSHFKSLVRRYQNRIYSAAYRILGNTEEAEEVVQETYIKVHHNLAKFRQESSFGSWIFKIAHNICIDILRSRRRNLGGVQLLSFDPQSSFDSEESTETSSSVVSQVADEAPCPSAMLDMNEQSEIIEASLKELPENQRTVVVLHDIEGFSYQEISDIVGANLGTVRSRLHYGRLRLRQLLEPYFSTANMSTASR
jgi:RNA polymerase sigma-70 factor (ECF subfamily)